MTLERKVRVFPLLKAAVLLLALSTLLASCAGARREPPAAAITATAVFPHGVAVGDVTVTGAVLWTRVDGARELSLEVAADSDFAEIVFRRSGVQATEENDFTVKLAAQPLEPGRRYYYRFAAGAAQSPVGAFRTPPDPAAEEPLRFVWSGDSNGAVVDGEPAFNEFEVLDQARKEEPDFFIYLGDTIYADFSQAPRARDLEGFRAKYRENRQYEALRGLLAATSTYAIWDDHEVRNDWDGETVDPVLRSAAERAFREYFPVGERQSGRLYGSFRWGQHAEVIILDARSYRSGDVEEACRMEGERSDPMPGLGAPAVPPAFRAARGLIDLPQEAEADCLAALSDPDRTMLGREQLAWLKETLLASDATFKFIITGVPIQEIYARPYDRWEGYRAERDELLRFLRENDVRNVVFLTTDIHASLAGDVRVNAFAEPGPVAYEVAVGPIAAETHRAVATWARDLLGRLGPIPESLSFDCLEPERYSYGLVEVTAEQAAVTLKDDTGTTFCEVAIPAR